MDRRRKYRIVSGIQLPTGSPQSSNVVREALYDAQSTSIYSRVFAPAEGDVAIIRACLPEGVTLALETGHIPPGIMPSGSACAGVVCAPFDATLQDACLLNVCCVAQNINRCGNVVAIPPMPGFMRLVLDPPSAVGSVTVYLEFIGYKAAALLSDSSWLGGCLTNDEPGGLKEPTSSPTAATTTDFPTAGDYGIHKNTTTGLVSLCFNDAGVIKSVALL